MKIRKESTIRIFNLAKYEIYRQKKQELLDFISQEMKIWGAYTEIPEPVQEFIDRELVVLGKFRKKIDISPPDTDAGTYGIQTERQPR